MTHRVTATGCPARVPWRPLLLGTGLAMVGAVVVRRVRSRRAEPTREEGRPPGVVGESGKESFPAGDPPQSW